VCDFTTATVLPKDQPDARVQLDAGTLAFNAPEQLNDADYLAKPLDVWAFGVSLYAYLTNSLPVGAEGSHQDFVKDHNDANFDEIVNNMDVTPDL
jgi:serine/threonine protein kinase